MKIWESGSVWCVNCYRNAVFWFMCCRETFFCLWYGFLNSLSKMETKLLSQEQGCSRKKRNGWTPLEVGGRHPLPSTPDYTPAQANLWGAQLIIDMIQTRDSARTFCRDLKLVSSRAGMRGFLWVVVFLDLGRLCLNEWICRNWQGTSGIC